MTTYDLLQALARLRVETGSLACLGCGREHNCSTKGCRILREAADLIRQLSDENTELREEVNLRGNAVRTAKRKRAKAEAERDALRENATQWVSVASRLPELWKNERTGELVNYIVRSPYFGVDIGNYHKEAGTWLCMGLPCTVTHWMPLPEAPEEEKT